LQSHPGFDISAPYYSRKREVIAYKDYTAMRDDDTASSDCHAAAGILQCLQMLATEADRRRLPLTHGALRKAIRACQAEQTPDRAATRRQSRRSLALH
jgi:hypothetical protein